MNRILDRNKTLHQIGAEARTDKVNSDHTQFSQSYMDRYSLQFNPIRNMNIRFLEIGILNGASLNAWRRFFPNAEIHGIDVRPECKVYENLSQNIHVHIVDCSSGDELSAFVAKYTNYFDVILDDGSHINDITLKTFRYLQNSLRSVGQQIVEDLGCAQIGNDLEEYSAGWPGISVTKEVPKENNPETMLDLYKQIHTMIDIPSKKNPYQIEFLHHQTFIVVLRKNEMYLTAPTKNSVFEKQALNSSTENEPSGE